MINTIAGQTGLLFLGLMGLWYTSEKVVEVSLALSKKINLNALFVGVIFISLVTGFPELVVGVMSVLNGVAQMSVGDVMGSNFIDTVLVIGVTVLLTGPMNFSPVKRKRLLFLLSLVALAMGAIFALGTINRIMGAVLFISYFLFVLFLYKMHSAPEVDAQEVNMAHKQFNTNQKLLVAGVLSFGGLFLSTEVAIYGAKLLTASLDWPQEFLGVTLFALATSLPEFVISYHAAKRKAYSLLMGNALGAALQQGLFTLGLVAMFSNKPLDIRPVYTLIPYMTIGFLVMGYMIWKHRRINYPTASLFLFLAVAFFAYEIYRL